MSETTEKKTYRLYALPPSWESVAMAVSERYSRATATPSPGYVLIYSAGEKPKGAREITQETKSLLSDADRQWLMECGAAILAEEAAKQQPELMRSLSERIEALESELKRRKEELEKKGE